MSLTADEKYELYKFKTENPTMDFDQISRLFSENYPARVELLCIIVNDAVWSLVAHVYPPFSREKSFPHRLATKELMGYVVSTLEFS